MLERLAHIGQAAGVVELIVPAVGFITIAVVAAGRRASRSRPPSSVEIASEAERYRQIYGEAALRRIGTEMHLERVARGIGPRYRYLSEISECLSKARHVRGNTAGAAAPAIPKRSLGSPVGGEVGKLHANRRSR